MANLWILWFRSYVGADDGEAREGKEIEGVGVDCIDHVVGLRGSFKEAQIPGCAPACPY